MYCIKCGNRMPDNAVFCPECGQNIASGSSHNSPTQTSEDFHETKTNFELKHLPKTSIKGQEKEGREWIIGGLVLAGIFTFPYWGILALFDTTPGFWGIIFWYWYPTVMIFQGIDYYKMSDDKWAEKIAKDAEIAKNTTIFLANLAAGFIRGYFSNRR